MSDSLIWAMWFEFNFIKLFIIYVKYNCKMRFIWKTFVTDLNEISLKSRSNLTQWYRDFTLNQIASCAIKWDQMNSQILMIVIKSSSLFEQIFNNFSSNSSQILNKFFSYTVKISVSFICIICYLNIVKLINMISLSSVLNIDYEKYSIIWIKKYVKNVLNVDSESIVKKLWTIANDLIIKHELSAVKYKDIFHSRTVLANARERVIT